MSGGDRDILPAGRYGQPAKRRLLIVCAIVGVALIAALTVVAVRMAFGHRSASAPAAQPPPPPDSYAVPGCYNPAVPPVERPKRLNVLGCASVAVALQDMSWSSWGPHGADGTGTAVFKICEPNCATGYQLTSPVVVHAWNAQAPRPEAVCQPGLKIFADMILAFPKGAPPPTAQKMNTQYNGMPAVHFANYSGGNPRDAQFIGYTFCN